MVKNGTGNSARMARLARRSLTLLLLSVLSLGGCDPRVQRPSDAEFDTNENLQSNTNSHLSVALSLVEELDTGITTGIETRRAIGYHLQEWGKSQQASLTWVSDPMIRRIPERGLPVADPQSLSSLTFRPYDVSYLIEAAMLRNVAKQVQAQPLLDLRLREQLERQAERMEPMQRDQLSQVIKLFDWTVRNIQLDPLDPVPAENAPQDAPPQPRPGARRFVWQTLMVGRGDAWVRARTFIMLARQLRIPAVVLGVEQEPEPSPWLIGVWIDQQLYLFDPVLGLPVPNMDGGGITTLQSLREHPEILDLLSLPDGPSYWGKPTDLNRLVALIDAPPEALSQRMAVIETALTGQQKMVLTTEPSSLGTELQKSQNLVRSQIWMQYYDTFLYHLRASQHRATMHELQLEMRLVEGDSPIAQARRLHIRGMYDSDPPRLGARSLYMAARPSNKEIEQTRNLSDAQIMEQVRSFFGDSVPDDVTPEQVRQILAAVRPMQIAAKQAASYWLGIVAFEHEQFDVAVDYFDNRTLQASPDGPWTQGARYNLARTYEIKGLTDGDKNAIERAVEFYRPIDDPLSPQAHGDRLRARRLQ